MKKLFISLIFLFVSLQGFSDTIDYWHVYFNDSVIARLNSPSQIEIDALKIGPHDTLGVRHGDDTPCHDCKFILLVRDDKQRKLAMAESNKFWGKLSINLNELRSTGESNDSKRYDFYYLEKYPDGKESPMILLLQLTIRK